MSSIHKSFLFLCLLQILSSCISAQVATVQNDIPEIHLDNLVQGRLYAPLYNVIRGNQYFNESWELGSVDLLDRSYSDLPFWYDIYADQVILIHRGEETFQLVQLIKEKIRAFRLGERKFTNTAFGEYSQLGLKRGFYEILWDGKLTLLCKRTKRVLLKDSLKHFERDDKWYLVIEETAIEVKNKKSFLRAIKKDYHKATSKFIKDNGIRLNRSGEREWLSLIKYLESLIQELDE